MFSEDDLFPLSALQHFVFCRRQCALIHIEQCWEENRLTAEGRLMHEKAHEETFENRPGVRIERGISLRSLQLGLIGKTDVVEFHQQSGSPRWLPFPVEYKRGKPKPDACDAVQLCAQALCLEEMLNLHIPEGALFYGKIRRRESVVFDSALRSLTEKTAESLHEFIAKGETPRAVYEKKCDSCSLIDWCFPKTAASGHSASEYLNEMVAQS
jgi:CRISPR-associated exonuclease Cas4